MMIPQIEPYGIIEIEGNYYRVQELKDTDGYGLEQIETSYCDECEELTEETECEVCGHDKRQPTIGGYDPELDIG